MEKRRRIRSFLFLMAITMVIIALCTRRVSAPELEEQMMQEATIQCTTVPQIETTTCAEEEEILTIEEFQLLCELGHVEFRGETLEGQIAGFATICNRVESSEFKADTFSEVINQSGQFSPVWDGEVHIRQGNTYVVVNYEDVSEKTILAAELALGGEDPTEQLLWDEAVRLGLDPIKYAEGGALYFYNPDGCSKSELELRAKIKVKIQIGDHIFYKYWDQ